jgi:hypothetical protein
MNTESGLVGSVVSHHQTGRAVEIDRMETSGDTISVRGGKRLNLGPCSSLSSWVVFLANSRSAHAEELTQELNYVIAISCGALRRSH